MTRFTLVLVPACLALVGCHHGSRRPTAAGHPPEVAILRVEVRMLDGDRPLTGAQVRLLRTAGDTLADSVDADGAVTFAHVPAGPVTVEVRRLGLLPVRRTITLSPDCPTRVVARLAGSRCDLMPNCGQPQSQLDVFACRPDV